MRWLWDILKRLWSFFFQSKLGQVVSFRLLNEDTGSSIIESIINNSVIDIATFPTRNILFDAVTDGEVIGSLRFSHNNNTDYMFDNTQPYTLCEGANKGGLRNCDVLIPGKHVIEVTPFANENGKGISGRSTMIMFTINDSRNVNRPCRTPKFDADDWENFFPKHPVGIGESHGVIIGNDIVTVGGFIDVFAGATNQTYARDVTNPNSTWRRMDDVPIPMGITHAAFALVGKKLYLCGGYLGGHPGPHTSLCFKYDHSKPPGSGQWSAFLNLPQLGTAGGGMVYDTNINTLYYAGGGRRNTPGSPDADDSRQSWKYAFDDHGSGWTKTTPILYAANHISFVTGIDDKGTERHYFFGGQQSENETLGNLDKNYEWRAANEEWIERARVPFARGHAASSSIPVGCGFIVAGGSVNNNSTKGKKRTTDVSYYDIPSNNWTYIGATPVAVNTPITPVSNDGYMYFLYRNAVSKRRKIEI